MKMIFCKNCSDLFKLDVEDRYCKCGESKGKYVDNINAVYSGENALPLGIDNRSLLSAMLVSNTGDRGVRFESFIIPDNYKTFIKLVK